MTAITAKSYIVTVEIEIIADSELEAEQGVQAMVSATRSTDIVGGEVLSVVDCGVMED